MAKAVYIVGGGVSSSLEETPKMGARYLSDGGERARRERWLAYITKMKELYGEQVIIDYEGKTPPMYIPKQAESKIVTKRKHVIDVKAMAVGERKETPKGTLITKLEENVVEFKYPNGVVKTVSEFPGRIVEEKIFPDGTKVTSTRFNEDAPTQSEKKLSSSENEPEIKLRKREWRDFIAFSTRIYPERLAFKIGRMWYSIAALRFNGNHINLEEVCNERGFLKEPYLSNLARHLTTINHRKSFEEIVQQELPLLLAHIDAFDGQ
ncbi:MAG: hypothetical protein QXR38_04105 [Nitrososphaerales archaeon]